jgi:hypothetical protein
MYDHSPTRCLKRGHTTSDALKGWLQAHEKSNDWRPVSVESLSDRCGYLHASSITCVCSQTRTIFTQTRMVRISLGRYRYHGEGAAGPL